MTGKNSKQNKAEPRQLPANYKLGRFDVICARGKLAQEHEGNIRMKALVQSCLPQYSQTTCKVTKSRIVSSIVDSVRQASPEGGFVKFVDDGWVCVNDRFAREKVGQQFRDLLHTKYRSSTKAKARARMQQTGAGAPDNLLTSNTNSNTPTMPMPPLTASVPFPVKSGVATTAMVSNFKNHADKPSLVCSALATHNDTSLAAQLSRIHTLPHPQLPTTSTNPSPAAVSASVPKPMPAPSSNFLGQLIQRLDRSSEGAHGEFEQYMMMKNDSVSSSSMPLPTSTGAGVQAQADWPSIASSASTAILSDLEPTPMKEDLRNTSAIFSIDAFLWEPRC